MLKQPDLDVALSNHDNEMALCEERRCDWALLHLVLAYPDICSGLQVSNPDGNIGQRYRSWCDQFLKTPHLTGAEWWAMRNSVLHQGSAIIKAGTRYARFEFSVATPPDQARADGDVMHLDVVVLSGEMKLAVAAWKACLLKTPPPPESAIVERSLGRLAAVYLPTAVQPARASQSAGGPSTAAPQPLATPDDTTTGQWFTPMKSK
jgi:hypothetical protein